MRHTGGYTKLFRSMIPEDRSKADDNIFYGDHGLIALFCGIICWANREDSRVNFRGEVKILKKGQLLTTKKRMASALGMSYEMLMRRLKVLEQNDTITILNNSRGFIITIKNYAMYQEPNRGSSQTNTKTNITSMKLDEIGGCEIGCGSSQTNTTTNFTTNLSTKTYGEGGEEKEKIKKKRRIPKDKSLGRNAKNFDSEFSGNCDEEIPDPSDQDYFADQTSQEDSKIHILSDDQITASEIDRDQNNTDGHQRPVDDQGRDEKHQIRSILDINDPLISDQKQVKSTAPKKKAVRKKKSPLIEGKSPGSKVFDSYSAAYRQRYGSDPVRNTMINSLCKQLVMRLGEEGAVKVAAFYVSHNDQFYIKKCHMLKLCIGDAEKLMTECSAGVQVTTGLAQTMELTSNNKAVVKRYLEKKRAKEAAARQQKEVYDV